MILRQCSQQLHNRIKQDFIWTTVATSYNTLQLIRIIDKTVLAQTEDQYPFAIVYEQKLSLYGFHQNIMTNDQCYERFNTKVDVGTSIGVTRKHSVLLGWTAQSIHSAYYQYITNDQNIEIQADTEEMYLAYIFLKQSAKTSENIRTNLSDDYTTGENKYPTSSQETLHFLEKHIKVVLCAPIAQEGSSFFTKEEQWQPRYF